MTQNPNFEVVPHMFQLSEQKVSHSVVFAMRVGIRFDHWKVCITLRFIISLNYVGHSEAFSRQSPRRL